MIGWGAKVGKVVGSIAGATRTNKNVGKPTERLVDAIQNGQMVLIAINYSQAQTCNAIDNRSLSKQQSTLSLSCATQQHDSALKHKQDSWPLCPESGWSFCLMTR